MYTTALALEDLVVHYLILKQSPDPSVGTDGVDGPVGLDLAHVPRRHKRAGRARLHAFAAGDTGGVAEGIVEVEHDLGVLTPERIADDVVDLLLAAGPHATPALYAGLQVRGDVGMQEIRPRLHTRREARLADPEGLRPAIEFRMKRVGRLGNVREEKLGHH